MKKLWKKVSPQKHMLHPMYWSHCHRTCSMITADFSWILKCVLSVPPNTCVVMMWSWQSTLIYSKVYFELSIISVRRIWSVDLISIFQLISQTKCLTWCDSDLFDTDSIPEGTFWRKISRWLKNHAKLPRVQWIKQDFLSYWELTVSMLVYDDCSVHWIIWF